MEKRHRSEPLHMKRNCTTRQIRKKKDNIQVKNRDIVKGQEIVLPMQAVPYIIDDDVKQTYEDEIHLQILSIIFNEYRANTLPRPKSITVMLNLKQREVVISSKRQA